MKLTHLKTLHRDSHIALDRNPYFSWVLESDKENTFQKAYRIQVFDSENLIVWDSQTVQSDKNDFIEYDGDKLESCETYSWNLVVTDNYGDTTEETSTFETAFFGLPFKETGANWVSEKNPITKREVGFGNQPRATYFKHEFQIDEEPIKAMLYMTSHGAYEFTINDEKLNERKLATEYSSFDKVLFYQNYDLTEKIIKGENLLSVTVGDGWYCSIKNMMQVELSDKYHALQFALKLKFTDGSTRWISSDETTQCTKGPIISSDLYGGEIYDAREEINEETKWENCVIRSFTNDLLKAQVSDGIGIVETLAPTKIYVSPKKETIIDFGQNMAGIVRVKTHLKADEELILDHFEATDKAGNYFNTILEGGDIGKGVEQRTKYISNGTEQVYEPHFTFQGFRFLKVSAPEGYKIIPEDFEALALSTNNQSVGSFECSDERINRLYENTIWSQRANMLSIPTDCPQREKAGWTGDIAIYAKTALQNQDVNAFLENWLISLNADQAQNGAVPFAVPNNHLYSDTAAALGDLFHNDGAVGSAGWGDAVIMIPWAMYEVSGNTDVLKKQYRSMKAWVGYIIDSCTKHRGTFGTEDDDKYLWDTGFHWGDWLIPSLSKKGYDIDLLLKAVNGTKDPVASMFGYNSILLLSKIAEILGKNADAQRYKEFSKNMKKTIQFALLTDDGKVRSEFMGVSVLLLAFNLVPDKFIKTVGQQLVQQIKKNDGCLDTGFLGTPFILDALCNSGNEDSAYQLLLNDKCPSWLYEVSKGATTIWESWFSYDENDEPLAVSFNHYAFGCVDDWIYRYVGGVFPTSPGYQTFDIKVPRSISLLGISKAKRSFFSKNGLLECEWEIKKNKLSLMVNVPCNTTAKIHLWDGTVTTVGSGKYRF